MPISDESLQSDKNRFLAVTADATVGQAIAALRAEGGQPWWHLLVRRDDESWGVIRFTQLHAALDQMASAADVCLADLQCLVSATAVDRQCMETKAAVALARKSPGKVLVVTDKGLPAGIIVEGVSRGGLSISSAQLGELGGKYVNLKDYSLILLSSSRSQSSAPKPDTPSRPNAT